MIYRFMHGIAVAGFIGIGFAILNYHFVGLANLTNFQQGYLLGMLVAYTLGISK